MVNFFQKFCFFVFLPTLFGTTAFAQAPEPIKVDEFSNITVDDLTARIDNISIELRNKPDNKAQILISRGIKDTPGSSFAFISRVKAFVTDVLKFDFDRRMIATVCAPQTEKRQVVAWLLPPGSPLKECEADRFEINETLLFDSVNYPNQQLRGCCIIGELGEFEAIGALEAFGDVLKNNPDAKGYIYLYLGTNIYWMGTSEESANRPVRKLDSQKLYMEMTSIAITQLKKRGIERSRYVIRHAGYKDSSRNLELWIVPEGKTPPKPKPTYFRRSGSRR